MFTRVLTSAIFAALVAPGQAFASFKDLKAAGSTIMQLGFTASKCTGLKPAVTTACCPTGTECTLGFPASCGSMACATSYMNYYQQCGSVIRAIEENKYSDFNGLSSLYASCAALKKPAVRGAKFYDFNTPGVSLAGWKVVVDGVMGGRSSGSWDLKTVHDTTGGASRTCAELSGKIELTHGGFVNVKAPTMGTPNDFQRAHGVRICTRSTTDYGAKDGTGDRYKLNIYDGATSYTSTTYSADFRTAEASATDSNLADQCDGTISTIPYNQLYPSHYGRTTGAQGSLDPSTIVGMGFDVSFVTADGGNNPELNHQACADGTSECHNLNPFGLCVQWIQPYKLDGSDAQH